MGAKAAIYIGIGISLVYDVLQIAMSWDNKILSSIGIFSLCVALYGLQQNLARSEVLELDWLKYYTIPMFILLFSEVSMLDDMYSKSASLTGNSIEKVLPGLTEDYLSSFWALLFSYSLPLLSLLIYMFAKIICWIGNVLVSNGRDCG